MRSVSDLSAALYVLALPKNLVRFLYSSDLGILSFGFLIQSCEFSIKDLSGHNLLDCTRYQNIDLNVTLIISFTVR